MARPGGDDSRHSARIAAAIFAVAVAVRLLYLVEMSGKPYFGSPILDSRYVLAQATHLLSEGAFPPGPFFRPPLYTIFVTGLVGIGGGAAPFAAALIQHLLGALGCVFIWACARRFAGDTAGIAAGLFAALCGPAVFYEGELLSDSLALFLNTGFLLWWVTAVSGNRRRDYAIAGAWAGLAAITRPSILIVAAGFVLAQLALHTVRALRGRRAATAAASLNSRTARSGMIALALFVVPIALLTAVPTIHNAAQGDPIFICSQGGVNLYIGNCADANGANIIIPRYAEESGDYRDGVEEFGVAGYLREKHGAEEGMRLYHAMRSGAVRAAAPKASEVSHFWQARAVRFVVSEPAKAASLYARKIVAAVNDHEVRNNRHFHFIRTHESWALWLAPVTFGWLFAFGVAGIALAWRAGAAGRWVILWQLLTAAGVVAYFVGGRLRLPMVPGMAVLAGCGVAAIVQAVRARETRRTAGIAAAAVAAGAVSFWTWPVLDFRYSQEQPAGRGILSTDFAPQEWCLLAVASLENGNAEAALGFAQKGAQADPGFAYAHLLAGNAALAMGRLDVAAAQYRGAIEAAPESTRAIVNLGVVMEKRGRHQNAAALYETALARNPADAVAMGNLAMLQFRSGMRREAQEAAARALAISPSQPSAAAVSAAANAATANVTPNTPADAKDSPLLREARTPLPAPLRFGAPPPLAELLAASTRETTGALAE